MAPKTKKKRELRSCDNRLNVLSVSPGEQHLEITGSKLPTYEQVLLCYMATMRKFRAEDGTKNTKLTAIVSNAVFEKVRLLYLKANIPMKVPINCAKDIRMINDEFKSVNKRKNAGRVEKFQTKMKTTMPFWPHGTLEYTEQKILNNLTEEFERRRLVEDSRK